jgi:phenol 2-monooxygenase
MREFVLIHLQAAKNLEQTIRRFTPTHAHPDAVIELILVLATKFAETEQAMVPEVFSPVTGKWGIKDLHKMYIDDKHYNAGHGHAYEQYSVDVEQGAVVVVRPDQYVAKVLSLEDAAGVERFLQGCLLEQRAVTNGDGKH